MKRSRTTADPSASRQDDSAFGTAKFAGGGKWNWLDCGDPGMEVVHAQASADPSASHQDDGALGIAKFAWGSATENWLDVAT